MYLQTGNESQWLKTERRRIEDMAKTSIDAPAVVDETEVRQSSWKLSPRDVRHAVTRALGSIVRRFAANRRYSAQT